MKWFLIGFFAGTLLNMLVHITLNNHASFCVKVLELNDQNKLSNAFTDHLIDLVQSGQYRKAKRELREMINE